MKQLERVLKALANRRRLAIVRYLKGHRDASVGQVAQAIRLSLKSTSKHLVILHSVDILEREQRSLQMYYGLAGRRPRPVDSVLALL